MKSDLLDKLKSRLSHPLPGNEAHDLMVPKLSSGRRINIRNTDIPKKGAVLVLLYKKNGEFHFPLIQRPVYKGVHSGQIALPGGRMEAQDPDLYHTALREANEEVGVNPDEIDIMGTLSEFFVAASNYQVLPVIGFYRTIPEFKPDEYEVDEIVEARLSELLDATKRKEKEIVTSQGYKLFSPYFDIKGKVVWGATAMMLSEFVEIIREI